MEIAVRVIDAANTTDRATARLTIRENQAPTADDDVYSVGQDLALVVDAAAGLLANDLDADGDAIEARLVDLPVHGSLALAADGSFEYIPDEGFSGTDTFTYRATDGVLTSDTATVTIRIGGYANVILADNPIGYWHLGETTGSTAAADASGNGLDGTYHGGVAWERPGALPADADTAVHLDGSTGYVAIGPDASLNQLVNDMTIEVWVKPDHLNGIDHILSTRALIGDAGGYALWRAGGQVGFAVWGVAGGGGRTTDDVLTAGRWQHVVAVFDVDNAVSFYLDGQFIETKQGSGPIDPNNQPLHIGRQVDGWGDLEYWQGEIDEVAIYNRSLTAEEIAEHYAAGLGGALPVAEDDAYTIDEDRTLVVAAAEGVAANDTLGDVGPLAATLRDAPAHGDVALEADGSFTYTPQTDFHGTDSFNLTTTQQGIEFVGFGAGIRRSPYKRAGYLRPFPDSHAGGRI